MEAARRPPWSDGPERRRRWTSAEKLRIVEESLAPGASVVEVASTT